MGEIRRVGVVGSGLMGSGIAEVCARAGLNVLVGEVSESAVQAGKNRVAKSLHRAVQAGKLTAADRETALTAIRFTTDLGELADRELVIEAVTERADAKSSVLATLDEIIADREAILASNTSSIPIMRLAMATRRAGQVIGIHFFNPVPVLSLVELIPSLLTSEETWWRAEAFVTATLGKTAIRGQDRAGFVVNALLIPYLLASIRMLESGFASAQDIRHRNGARLPAPDGSASAHRPDRTTRTTARPGPACPGRCSIRSSSPRPPSPSASPPPHSARTPSPSCGSAARNCCSWPIWACCLSRRR